MEVAIVRKQLLLTMERVRRGAQERRQRAEQTERAYEVFLTEVATPVMRQLAAALKAERLPFAVSTPGGSIRLSSDNVREDFIEVRLESGVDPPEVVARISRSRGSRTLTGERPIKPGASPDAISEDDVLTFLLTALEPWLER